MLRCRAVSRCSKIPITFAGKNNSPTGFVASAGERRTLWRLEFGVGIFHDFLLINVGGAS